MPTELILMADVLAVRTAVIPEESSQSATSWGAIAAGGIASAAFTLFLVELVAGLGLVMVSPWSNQGASASTLSVAGGIGLILMAVMASALGGYIAGRLRTRWVGIKTDEVYFRDTAHGLLAWAVGTIILATVPRLRGRHDRLRRDAGRRLQSGAGARPQQLLRRQPVPQRPAGACECDRSGHCRSVSPDGARAHAGQRVHGE
jgi:hypothetical protein